MILGEELGESDVAMGTSSDAFGVTSDAVSGLDPRRLSSMGGDIGDLPGWDDALIPEALGVLGFDVVHTNTAPPLVGAPSPPPDEIDDDDDAQAKRSRAQGGGTSGNQREVQKRYRERKKNHVKMLEEKVKTLEARLAAMQHREREKAEDDVIAHVAVGALVETTRACGGGGGDGDAGEEGLAYAANPSHGIKKCPLEHQRFLKRLEQSALEMKALLDQGASDADIRAALARGFEVCAGSKADGATGACSEILASNARALNDERRRALSDAAETKARNADAGAPECTSAPVCASIFGGAGGPLRTVGFDGEIRNEEEMREHHDRACDDLLAHCPPVDAETLVAWRDEYVSKLGDIYAQRRTLGMMLASSGSEITVSSATPQHHGGGFDDAKAIGAGERERDEGGDDDHRADQKAVAKKMDASHSARGSDGSDGTDEAAVARFAIHAPRGEKGAAATAAAGGSSSADVETFAGQGRVVVDALKVVEALKESVRSELALKMTESKRLVFELVQPRSAARLFWACHPLVPDPLGVASRMKERGIGPKKPSRDAAAAR